MLHQSTANLNVILFGNGLAVALVPALAPNTCAAAIAFYGTKLDQSNPLANTGGGSMLTAFLHLIICCPITTFSITSTQHVQQLVVL